MSKRIHEFAIEAVYAAARARPAIDGLRVYYEANPRGATHDELIAACESALLGGGSGGGSALLCSNPFGRLSEGRRGKVAPRSAVAAAHRRPRARKRGRIRYRHTSPPAPAEKLSPRRRRRWRQQWRQGSSSGATRSGTEAVFSGLPPVCARQRNRERKKDPTGLALRGSSAKQGSFVS